MIDRAIMLALLVGLMAFAASAPAGAQQPQSHRQGDVAAEVATAR